MPATVFVVTICVYTSTMYDDFDTNVVGVFTARELADAYIATHPSDEYSFYGEVAEVPFTDYVG